MDIRINHDNNQVFNKVSRRGEKVEDEEVLRPPPTAWLVSIGSIEERAAMYFRLNNEVCSKQIIKTNEFKQIVMQDNEWSTDSINGTKHLNYAVACNVKSWMLRTSFPNTTYQYRSTFTIPKSFHVANTATTITTTTTVTTTTTQEATATPTTSAPPTTTTIQQSNSISTPIIVPSQLPIVIEQNRNSTAPSPLVVDEAIVDMDIDDSECEEEGGEIAQQSQEEQCSITSPTPTITTSLINNKLHHHQHQHQQ